MPEFVFRRSFPWLQGALDPLVPSVFPGAIAGTVAPVIDIFGSQRIVEQQFENVLGDPDAVEVTHSKVREGTIRFYSTIEALHTDPAENHWIRIGQVLEVPAFPPFPFVSFQNAAFRAGDPGLNLVASIAIRSMWVGPGNRAAVRVDAIGVTARIRARFVWVDLPLGESIRFT